MTMRLTAGEDTIGRTLGLARSLASPRVRRMSRALYTLMPMSWRHTSQYRQLSRMLERSQWWNLEQHRDYQLDQLRQVISVAERYSPEYRARFQQLGVGSRTLRSLDDLAQFPFLTKEDLRQNSRRFVLDMLDESQLDRVTSGATTGAPTVFYHQRHQGADVFLAFRLALWKRIGYEFGHRVVDLTMSFDAPYTYLADRATLGVSITHLDDRHAHEWIDRVVRFRPEFVIGFPSTTALFAQLVDAYAPRFGGVRGVITSSEVLAPAERALLRRTFGAPVLAWYGMSEVAGFAAGCEHDDAYHFSPEAGILEVVGDDGRVVRTPGAEGEIVLTSLQLHGTPFIRYRTGDRAIVGESACSKCGRNYPIVRAITGRTQDYLVGRWGRRIPISALNNHSNIFDGIRAYQFRQSAPGTVRLCVVPAPDYSPERLTIVRDQMSVQLGEDVTLEAGVVENIPRTMRGKHRFIVREFVEAQ